MQHTSLYHVSVCTAKAIRSYFVDGTLPSPGTPYEPDVPVFYAATEPVAPIANITKRSLTPSAAVDEHLWAALQQVQRKGVRWP